MAEDRVVIHRAVVEISVPREAWNRMDESWADIVDQVIEYDLAVDDRVSSLVQRLIESREALVQVEAKVEVK